MFIYHTDMLFGAWACKWYMHLCSNPVALEVSYFSKRYFSKGAFLSVDACAIRGGPLDIQGGLGFFPPARTFYFFQHQMANFFFPKTHTIKLFFSGDISNQTFYFSLLFTCCNRIAQDKTFDIY